MDFSKNPTDEVLISEIQMGSEEAFALLYGKYEGRLMGYLYSKLRNQEIAEEIFQISWSKVLDNIHKYKFTDTFKSWLFTIATNSAKDWFKKTNNQTKVLEALRQSNDHPQSNQNLPLELNFLESNAKKIIELQYVQGLTSKEISKNLNLSEANVRKISSRAKQQIKNHILNGGSLS